MKILVLNSGSSSCKLALYDVSNAILSNPYPPIWHSSYEWKNSGTIVDHSANIEEKLREMPISIKEVQAVGHRLVHGGSEFNDPVIITEQVKEKLQSLSPLAPLHLPQNLKGIEIIDNLIPSIPQIAVFDTSFHQTLSESAATYAGPYQWREIGIKRYGFHGISYQYCSARCSVLLHNEDLKLICCHLGNGASMAAIDRSRSVDTTMGFTPLEGLMMGTRSGSIDPGILLFLEQHQQLNSQQIFNILNESSGLLGISGITGDMREIIALCAENNRRAQLSFDMYIHSLKKNIGSMIAVLDKLDALIFTAGIGENAPLVRQATCARMEHLGISLDDNKNLNCRTDAIISSEDSKVKILVISTQEDWCIACTIEKMRSDGKL